MRGTVLLLLVILAIGFPCVAGEIDGRRDDLADRLAGHLLTQLEARKAHCSEAIVEEFELSVIYCGKLRKSETPADVPPEVDRIMEPYAAAEGPWEVDENGSTRNYRMGKVLVTVRLDAKSRIANVLYPIQGVRCPEVPGVRKLKDERPITSPVLIQNSKVRPEYSKLARAARVNGSVTLQAVVRRDGTVTDLCVHKSSHPGFEFEAAAIDAVSQWRYEPATDNGEPIDVSFTVVVDFSLSPM